MGLLALGHPLFAEPSATWRAGAVAEQRLAASSTRFLHPLVTLLTLAAAESDSARHAPSSADATLGWEALRGTSLHHSVWMVRDRWMSAGGPHSPLDTPFACQLRC